MNKLMATLILFSVFALTLPAMAQKKAVIKRQGNVTRVRVPAVGNAFNMKLNAGTYVIDPFNYVLTPVAEISSGGGCRQDHLSSNSGNTVGFFTIIQIQVACRLSMRVVENGSNGSGTMTFIAVKKEIRIPLTKDWITEKLGRGTYAALDLDRTLNAEVDPRSGGCAEAYDSPGNHIGIGDDIKDGGAYKIGIESYSWFRVLPKPCKLRLRLLHGDEGTLTLLKLSNGALLHEEVTSR